MVASVSRLFEFSPPFIINPDFFGENGESFPVYASHSYVGYEMSNLLSECDVITCLITDPFIHVYTWLMERI